MNSQTRILSFFIVLAMSSLFCGCGTYRGSRTSSTPLELMENLVYLDAAAVRQIPCQALEAERLESGRVRVYARFLNKRNATAECQVKVKFKNAAGRVVDETGWMPFVLPRREVAQFEHTSLSANAKDFTLMLRAAK